MENFRVLKKNIKEDWLNTFPGLYAFTANKYYKIVGCLIVGIELVNIPNIEGYKPHFVAYPLWKDNIDECLNIPFLYVCLMNNKGLQFSVPYIKHTFYFKEILECLKTQMPLLLTENIALKSLLEYTDRQFSDFLIKANLAMQIRLFELEFYATLYTGDQIESQYILNKIKKSSKGWNIKIFETWNDNFDQWFTRLEGMINQRHDFLKCIEFNQCDRKILSLKKSEIVW